MFKDFVEDVIDSYKDFKEIKNHKREMRKKNGTIEIEDLGNRYVVKHYTNGVIYNTILSK